MTPKNIFATLKCTFIDLGKTALLLALMSVAYASIISFGDSFDPTFVEGLVKMMIIAGVGTFYFTSAGIYQSICMGMGCTRREYFTAIQISKVFTAILVSLFAALIAFIFTKSETSVLNIVQSAVSYWALFSFTEFFGHVTRKMGRWGLVILVLIVSFGAGMASALLISRNINVFSFLGNYTLLAVLAVLGLIFTFISYLFNKKYVVRG